jgi:hypothetical protein
LLFGDPEERSILSRLWVLRARGSKKNMGPPYKSFEHKVVSWRSEIETRLGSQCDDIYAYKELVIKLTCISSIQTFGGRGKESPVERL